MGVKPDILTETGLQFFGRISASISHEIKNVLAIINENAGLLEDLTFMANKGKPIDPDRLKRMAATVQKQIGRGDEILKNMNRFAHSIDETVAEVDLNQTIELIIALPLCTFKPASMASMFEVSRARGISGTTS